MRYNKLVRDNVPEIMRAKGANPVTHVADDNEYREKLKAKLVEEAGEYFRDESEAEIADVLEVIDAIISSRGLDRARIEELKRKKKEERGGFEGRVILDEG